VTCYATVYEPTMTSLIITQYSVPVNSSEPSPLTVEFY